MGIIGQTKSVEVLPGVFEQSQKAISVVDWEPWNFHAVDLCVGIWSREVCVSESCSTWRIKLKT